MSDYAFAGTPAGDALARFRSGDLTAALTLSELRGPLAWKRSLSYAASETAARLLLAQPHLAPALRRDFCLVAGGVVASPAPGDGREPLLLRADATGRIVREPGLPALGATSDGKQQVARLIERHGWTLSPGHRERLRESSAFQGVHGMGRHEFLSVLHTDEVTARELSPSGLADLLYPLWKPRALGLTLTYRCNASCDHCYNASGPNRSPKCLGWSETGEHLTDWALAGVTDFGISGGEPFLYPELVIQLVGELKRLGARLVSPFTNGFWGKDEALARSILNRLRDVGFGSRETDQIKISTGDFHAPFVPFDDVLRIARLHREIVGTSAILDVAHGEDDDVLRTLVREAKALGLEKAIRWTSRATVSDSGRARGFYPGLRASKRSLAEMRCPIKAAGTLYPSGDWVYCSGTSYPTDFRRLGNLVTDGTFTVLARAQLDARVPYWQHGTFADYLADHPRAGFEDGTVMTPKNGTVCGTCRAIFAPTPINPLRREPARHARSSSAGSR